MSIRRVYRIGFTLIELLVVVATLGLMVALIVPAMTLTASESRRLRSLDNLKRIGQCSFTWSEGRADGIIHPQSSSGETNWRGLGAFDWGGSDGTDPFYVGNIPPNFGAQTRPLSKLCTSGRTLMFSDFSAFHAPADVGQTPNPNYWDPWVDSTTSMALSKGTSYQGDFIWFNAGGVGLRFGTFMRPRDLMPVPSETTLFYESRFGQAFISSQEFIDGGAFGGTAVDVPGWYGDKSKFCVLFADLNAHMVKVRSQGDLFPISSFDPVVYPNRSVMARGPGWRIDCFPAPFIEEHSIGDP